MDNFSHAGYVAWFGLIEIICKENGHNVTGKLEISPIYLKRKLRISTAKLEQIFNFCSGKVQQNPDKSPTKPKLLFNKTKEKWSFEFPKIAELKDNYTKDLQASSKKLSHHKEVEEEVEEEEEIKTDDSTNKNVKNEKNKPKDNGEQEERFKIFYSAYPKKKGKVAAIKAWSKILPDETLLQTMLCAIEKQKRSHSWIKEGGEYVPHPATWLNGRRWEDESVEILENRDIEVLLGDEVLLKFTDAEYRQWKKDGRPLPSDSEDKRREA